MTPAPLTPDLIRSGDRGALARAITLAESTRHDHREQAEALLAELLPHTGGSIRVGISGPPGVGKSTFIESLGLMLVARGHKVAVLAVDPSSRRSGGSILGDKTRMESLGREPDAFIRPTPAGVTMGGVARRTRDVVLLCEAAGFDVVIVETVGVGQSETAVSKLTDCFVLLINPGGGDDLQGIKRGIMELADVVVVTKADGDLLGPARITAADYGAALHLMRPKWPDAYPCVLMTSIPLQTGVPEMWDAVTKFVADRRAAGQLDSLRSDQAKAALWDELVASSVDKLRTNDNFAELETRVANGELLPATAARALS